MMTNQTIICKKIKAAISEAVGSRQSDDIYILTDDNSLKFCYPLIQNESTLIHAHVITIPSGDENKNIESLMKIWQYLCEHGATRKSLLINLGGGMITDIGGFAASTFKRGIEYINVATTLLGAVDAATGGKTGINFLGLKNEIGVFNPASHVLIYIDFFKTLDAYNLRSGFAEMIKHALIDTKEEWQNVLKFDLDNVNYEVLHDLVERSVRIKERVVEQDPREQYLRKALNLGHTFAHAFETFAFRMHRPVLHGYAVMWGLVCELYLSHIKHDFPKKELLKLKYLTKDFYGHFNFECKDYEMLYEIMTHDKKNESKEIYFTLLSGIGQIKINQNASKEEIFEALDYYLMG